MCSTARRKELPRDFTCRVRSWELFLARVGVEIFFRGSSYSCFHFNFGSKLCKFMFVTLRDADR